MTSLIRSGHVRPAKTGDHKGRPYNGKVHTSITTFPFSTEVG